MEHNIVNQKHWYKALMRLANRKQLATCHLSSDGRRCIKGLEARSATQQLTSKFLHQNESCLLGEDNKSVYGLEFKNPTLQLLQITSRSSFFHKLANLVLAMLT